MPFCKNTNRQIVNWKYWQTYLVGLIEYEYFFSIFHKWNRMLPLVSFRQLLSHPPLCLAARQRQRHHLLTTCKHGRLAVIPKTGSRYIQIYFHYTRNPIVQLVSRVHNFSFISKEICGLKYGWWPTMYSQTLKWRSFIYLYVCNNIACISFFFYIISFQYYKKQSSHTWQPVHLLAGNTQREEQLQRVGEAGLHQIWCTFDPSDPSHS